MAINRGWVWSQVGVTDEDMGFEEARVISLYGKRKRSELNYNL
jgi:hypothetical protein